MEVIVATGNLHKIEEIQNKFKDIKNISFKPMTVLGDIPEIIEDGATFEENALIKARTIAKLTKSAVMSDDSGLVVDSLNGEPGIFSARYGGVRSDRERYELLLENMRNIPYEKRDAYFIAVIAIILPDGREFTVEGKCHGKIADAPRGEKGFGYDPVFLLPEKNITMAEIPMDEKNRISHRALALEKAHEIFINQIAEQI